MSCALVAPRVPISIGIPCPVPHRCQPAPETLSVKNAACVAHKVVRVGAAGYLKTLPLSGPQSFAA